MSTGRYSRWDPKRAVGDLSVLHIANTIRDQCQLMMVHYAIVQTMLIGLAGFHKAEFATGHVIKMIQSCMNAGMAHAVLLFRHSLFNVSRFLASSPSSS